MTESAATRAGVARESGAPEEIRLDLDWGGLAGLTWRRNDGRRILCLHGWMDNAASFVPLANPLSATGDLDIVALDNAGHGRSDHRPPATRYYFSDYLFDIDAVLDVLEWPACTIIGHSMGAALGTALAAAAPERVEALVMLDGLGLVTEAPAQAAERLRNAVRAVRRPREHRRRFPTVEDAAAIRRSNSPMGQPAAMLLSERALAESGDGWRWRTDARAMWPSPVFMTEPQSDAILDAIECPVLVVVTPALEGYLGDGVDRRLGHLADPVTVRLDGGHHLHMDDPGPVADAVLDFLNTKGAPP